MSDMYAMPMPQPGETGTSATITIEIAIDSFPSLVAARNGQGDALSAVEDAIDAALGELPELISELSEDIMRRYAVRMYLIEDDDEDERG